MWPVTTKLNSVDEFDPNCSNQIYSIRSFIYQLYMCHYGSKLGLVLNQINSAHCHRFPLIFLDSATSFKLCTLISLLYRCIQFDNTNMYVIYWFVYSNLVFLEDLFVFILQTICQTIFDMYYCVRSLQVVDWAPI